MIGLTKSMNANNPFKSLPVRYFEFKPKIDYARFRGVGYADAALNQDIERLRDLWEKVQASRARDAIYDYLIAAYELVRCWQVERQESQRAQRALKINGLAPPKDPEPFAAVIVASVSPKQLDRRQISKYARVLRFSARLNIHPRDFKRVIKDRFGGLNACAARF